MNNTLSFNDTSNGFNCTTIDGPNSTSCLEDDAILVPRRGGARSGGGRRFGRQFDMLIPCGHCDTACVYNSIEMGFVVGVLANIIVIIRVYRDKKLRDPTFVAIACLAFADALFLSLNLCRSFDEVILTITCGYPSKLLVKPFYMTQSITWFAANSHVALMAILRYITIAYPLKSVLILTVKRVLFASLGIWFLGLILIGTFSILISYGIILPGRSQEFVIILWTMVYLSPVCVTTILHVMKMCVVKKTTRDSATESTKRSVRRMSRIVIMVIVFAMTLPLPRLIGKFFRAAGVKYPSREFSVHFLGIADLLFLINHFINPFMYGFLSKRFRNSIKDMLWFIKFAVSDSGSTDTTETPVSSRRSNNISMDRLPSPKTSTSSMDSVNSIEKRKKY